MPPAAPVAGQVWLVAASPTGVFAGHAGSLAGWTADGWRFILPRDGLRVFDRSERMPSGCMIGGWRRQVVPARAKRGHDDRLRGSRDHRR